jgi:hypothetical protein
MLAMAVAVVATAAAGARAEAVALVRGRTLVPVRASLKEQFGDAGWKRVLAQLAPADRAILDGLIVPDNWYERRLHTGMLEAAETLFRPDYPDVGERIGRRVAAHHDRFYLRPLLRLGGPMMLVRRASAIYREYFQGGEMAVVEQREHGARVMLSDPYAPRFVCRETLPAFCVEIVRLAGREMVHVTEPVCRHAGTGQDHCELDLEWR